MWREPESIKATEQYARIVIGVIFALLFVYLVVAGRVDTSDVLKVIVGTLGTFHLSIAGIRAFANKP